MRPSSETVLIPEEIAKRRVDPEIPEKVALAAAELCVRHRPAALPLSRHGADARLRSEGRLTRHSWREGPAHKVVGRIAAKKRVVGDTPHGGRNYQECGWDVATEWLAVGVILDDDDDDRQFPAMLAIVSFRQFPESACWHKSGS